MRTTRAHFKYALRFAKRQRETAEAESLARDLSNKYEFKQYYTGKCY